MPNLSKIETLLDYAEKHKIRVFYGFFPACKGIALDGCIAVHNGLNNAEEAVCIAHEMGHLETGALYQLDAPQLDRIRAERKATKWAIKKLVPVRKLEQAIRKGYSPFELAEIFDVTEEFIKKAVIYYAQSERVRFRLQTEREPAAAFRSQEDGGLE